MELGRLLVHRPARPEYVIQQLGNLRTIVAFLKSQSTDIHGNLDSAVA